MLEKKQNPILFGGVGAIITILFVLKCLLATDISFSDEMSYIAMALRFYKGDAMLVDDWTPVQLNGFLLMPLVGIYYSIFGSMEGVVFAFRLVYLLMKVIISVFAIYRLYNYGYNRLYSLLGVAFYYFCSPYNIDTLSYNTIPISMIFLITVIILTNKNSRKDWVVCGVCLALAILGHPFIIISYIVFSAILLIHVLVKRKKGIVTPNGYEKKWCYVTFGSICVAVLFICFILSRASLTEILTNLPYILQEPDHSSTFLTKSVNMIYDFLLKYIYITIINCILIIFCIALKRIDCLNWLSLGALIFSCIYLFATKDPFIENLIYIPFLWYGIEQLLLCRFEIKGTVVYLIILLSALGIYLGTNTRMLSTSAMMSNFASLSCFIIAMNRSENESKKSFDIIRLVLLGIIVGSTLILRLFIVWTSWFSIDDFRNYIDRGPLRGMYSVENVWNDYYTVLHDLDSIEYTEQDVFFCGTSTPLTYLYMNLEYGTMGISFFFLDYDRINSYWEMHPDKKPDIIYYYKLSDTDEEKMFISELYESYQISNIEDRLIATKR